ncbi:type I polyketide synthase, partial [Streptomyces cinerochromogenes]|uniref:type I polyketide synthase n=1 Tax=Streptomyces cinerochromogenes TaxID=66422 RepID=UPI0033B7F460
EKLREQGRRVKRLTVSHAFHSALMEPMLADFEAALSGLTWNEPTIPVVSNVTGRLAEPGQLTDPTYWVDHVRRPVRFADGIGATSGSVFLELGPGGALTGAITESAGEDAVSVPALRDDRDETQTLLSAVARLFVHGTKVNWAATLPDGAVEAHVDLPTYAFDHRHYWLQTAPATDAVALGQSTADHPLLGAVVEVPETGGLLCTSRLSLRTHPWLADHAVGGVVLVPGTGLVELAVRAGDEAGCAVLDELVIEAPLVVPEQGGVRVQVAVGGPDDNGSRTVAVYSAREDTAGGIGADAWTRHATGTLTTTVPATGGTFDFTAWPPPGAERVEVDVDAFYSGLIEKGYTYGPVFQGLRAVWRRGGEVYAEVAVPDGQREEAARFGIHPALLDAALHANGFVTPDGEAASGTTASGATAPRTAPRTVLPFAWNRLALHAVGASALRVRVAPSGPDAVTVQAADETGAPVLTTDSLVFREVTAEQLEAAAGASGADALFRVEWTDVTVPVRAGGPVPDWARVVTAADLAGAAAAGTVPEVWAVPADGPDDEPLERTSRVLGVLQAWLAEERLADSRLVVVTWGAVPAAGEETAADPAGAAVWGLVRAAQAENPDRITLIDTDVPPADDASLAALLATALAAAEAGEPQLALRGTTLRAPRLVRAAPARPDTEHAGWDPDGTVLITGGTGSLGALLARHLVERRGVRHLLLASRRGPDAEGAGGLVAELTALGAETARVAACDITDRDAVAVLLDSVPGEHPLTAVLHTAGVLDDGVIGTLDRERLDRVFAPKVVAVRHLDELTRARDLTTFAVFSSASGLFGSAGQGNYAAANAWLDAAMARRRAAGLPALSLAWGPWEQTTGMTAGTEAAARTRGNRRGGILPLAPQEGLALFDAALTGGDTLLVPVKLDLRAVRTEAATGSGVPPLLRQLVRAGRQSARAVAGDGGNGLLRRLAGLDRDRQEAVLLDVVRGHVAGVLGHAGADGVGTETAFKDAGFDSLTSVELRNRLRAATGVNLSATVVFDYPTPLALARHLHGELVPEGAVGQRSTAEADEERLRHALLTLPLDRFREAGLLDALVELAAIEYGAPAPDEPDTTQGALADLDVDDLVHLALGDSESLEG